MEIHKMKLDSRPFDLLINGKKDVELRLYDFKRQCLSVGDRIIFSLKDDEEQQFAVEIKALYIYASFEDLFSEIPLVRCGFEDNATIQEAVSIMRTYYKKEKEIEKGVIGISMKPVDTNYTQMKYKELREAEKARLEKDIALTLERLFPDGMK